MTTPNRSPRRPSRFAADGASEPGPACRWGMAAAGGGVLLLAGAALWVTLARTDRPAGRAANVSCEPAPANQASPPGEEPAPAPNGRNQNHDTSTARKPVNRPLPRDLQPFPSTPAQAKNTPPAPRTVVPLGGGRLLHPGPAGMFAFSEQDGLQEIAQPGDATEPPANPMGCI